MKNQEELKGLGGWLILVGLGVLFSPVFVAKDWFDIIEFFKDDSWKYLLDSNSSIYDPQLFYFICIEIVINIILFIAAVYAIYLFFSKHYRFPKYYIGLMAGYFLVLLIDTISADILIPKQNAFDEGVMSELVKSFLRMCIWITYLLFSVRVKNTFIEKRPSF